MAQNSEFLKIFINLMKIAFTLLFENKSSQRSRMQYNSEANAKIFLLHLNISAFSVAEMHLHFYFLVTSKKNCLKGDQSCISQC